MARALDLAWQGWGQVAPNPLVGAVVLSGGDVVGEGYHAEFGGRHAEPVALEAAGAGARDATLVVTLEPCAHLGKQPPCTDAILGAGIRRVVYALSDPNPLAAGGARILRERGLDVHAGLCEAAAAAQNALFLHRFRNPTRPFVALKLAASIDGRIADREGQSRWISGIPAREWAHWLRAGFDAIAVGGATARADDPALTVRGGRAPRRAPSRVVFSRSGGLAAGTVLVQTAREVPTLVVTTEAPDPVLAEAGVQYIRGDSLGASLVSLRALGIESLLVEGGGRIAAALLGERLVDRIYWVQAPVTIGRGVPMVGDFGSGLLGDAHRWRVVERRALGEDTLLVMDA